MPSPWCVEPEAQVESGREFVVTGLELDDHPEERVLLEYGEVHRRVVERGRW